VLLLRVGLRCLPEVCRKWQTNDNVMRGWGDGQKTAASEAGSEMMGKKVMRVIPDAWCATQVSADAVFHNFPSFPLLLLLLFNPHPYLLSLPPCSSQTSRMHVTHLTGAAG
jgi:hypothetical protein